MIGKVEIFNAGGWSGDTRPIKSFLVVYRYKTRPCYRKGKWKSEEKSFAAHDLAEALRLAKSYAEATYRGQWVVDVCSEIAANFVHSPARRENQGAERE